MIYSFHMPVKLFFGEGCVGQNSDLFDSYKKAFIVTGKSAAKRSGALDDVTAALMKNRTAYEICDGVSENPSLEFVHGAGLTAAESGADLIIGIGGGSPVDAAKAIAAFAANPQMAADELYSLPHKNRPLPIIAVVTTAGTGTEVNPYAIITTPDGVKKNYSGPHSFPLYSFLDPAYTASCPHAVTLSTAIDALSHCAESYLSPRSIPLSEMFALEGARLLWKNILAVYENRLITPEKRAALMTGAMYGGLAINSTGTGFPHPMGYNITLDYGTLHGFACAFFYREFLTYNEQAAPERCRRLYKYMGDDGELIKDKLVEMSGIDLKLDEETIGRYVEKIREAKGFTNSFRKIAPEEITGIYRRTMGK